MWKSNFAIQIFLFATLKVKKKPNVSLVGNSDLEWGGGRQSKTAIGEHTGMGQAGSI